MSIRPATLSGSLAGAATWAAEAIVALKTAWERRRIVGQLGALDDHMLADIGISRHDILSVLAEPLYRDPSECLALRAAETRRARRAASQGGYAYALRGDEALSTVERRVA